jgi:putative phosphoesterase
MKLLVISDIHGSLYYAKKALEAFLDEKADYIIILGDELYHGPRNPLPKEYNPKETAQLLNGFSDRIIAVRGNCDGEVDEMVLNFPIMATYSNILCDGRRLFLTHGHVYNEDNLPELGCGDVFLYGHTHIPRAERLGNIYIINPGSISMPKENNPNTYGILENNIFTLKDFEKNSIRELIFA